MCISTPPYLESLGNVSHKSTLCTSQKSMGIYTWKKKRRNFFFFFFRGVQAYVYSAPCTDASIEQWVHCWSLDRWLWSYLSVYPCQWALYIKAAYFFPDIRYECETAKHFTSLLRTLRKFLDKFPLIILYLIFFCEKINCLHL